MDIVERFQELAYNGGLAKELPPQFIRPSHERPENTKAIVGVTVPEVSLAQSHDEIVDQVSKACEEWGFLAITDHEIPSRLIERLREVGAGFFALPLKDKEAYSNDAASGNFEGYGTKMLKQPDEKIEWIDYFFHLAAPPSKVNRRFWPRQPPSYSEVTEEYTKEIVNLTDKILQLLSEALGLKPGALKSSLGGDEIEAEMKINHYPPCPQPELALGVEAHTDMSALTLLVPNEVAGLQVWKDGNWVAVDYVPGSILVHVGDQIEVLSNGKYKAVLHRTTVNKERTRMSWAMFMTPPHDKEIGPLPELVDVESSPPKYPTKTFGEYRYRKINKLPQ
ncbi:Flavonol synthase/flavanone 3-hydroxylase [Linum perenne]